MMFTSFSLIPAAVASTLVSVHAQSTTNAAAPTEIVRSLSFCFFKCITGSAGLARSSRNDKVRRSAACRSPSYAACSDEDVKDAETLHGLSE
ncbi:hypothetical protein C8Q74DRAFT_1243228 [Fomes fomentarius]|nr:hypothetical protein C8Q74DRAFT_1243228 [Fomes fomentarius]